MHDKSLSDLIFATVDAVIFETIEFILLIFSLNTTKALLLFTYLQSLVFAEPS